MLTTHESEPHTLVEKLREAIIYGEFRVGELLKQDKLAQTYQVSKIPVREALHQLKTEGLVSIINNRGSKVSALSVNDVKDIYKMRVALETMLLKNSIEKMQERDFIRAENALRLIDITQSSTEWAKLNWMFHVYLYEPANMPKSIEVITYLHNNVVRYLLAYLEGKYLRSESRDEHLQLVAYCKERRVDSAVQMLSDHLDNSMQKIIDHLTNNRENT